MTIMRSCLGKKKASYYPSAFFFLAKIKQILCLQFINMSAIVINCWIISLNVLKKEVNSKKSRTRLPQEYQIE